LLGTQGHIEDIAIKSEAQGKKFGVRLLEALDFIAAQVGCYKVSSFHSKLEPQKHMLIKRLDYSGLLSR
jgi:hypothetical protein